ncbi:MAG: hypothetical protein HKN72_17195 [Gemmatimonadetes bacterium]|nr:hypothetical protein [Gemmatimonadota bacterium]
MAFDPLGLPATHPRLTDYLRTPARRAALVLTVAFASCDVVGPRACTAEFVYGIVVTVVDAETGAPVTEGLSGVTVEDGVTTEMDIADNVLFGAGENEGVHAVVIAADGYDLWTRNGVRVAGGPCHVTTVELTAPMTPSTG